MANEQNPGADPLGQLLGQLDPAGDGLELEDPGGDLGAGFGVQAGVPAGASDPGATQGDPGPAPRGRASKDPYRVSVIAINTGVTPATYLRCLSFWATEAHQERAKLLTPEQQLCEYLDTVTYQHAAEDEKRDLPDRLYDWEELHMQGLRPKIRAEIDAIRAQVAQETQAGTRDSILSLVSALPDLSDNARARVLTAIQEMVNLDFAR